MYDCAVLPDDKGLQMHISTSQNIKLKKLSILLTSLDKDYVCCMSQLYGIDVPEKECHTSITIPVF